MWGKSDINVPLSGPARVCVCVWVCECAVGNWTPTPRPCGRSEGESADRRKVIAFSIPLKHSAFPALKTSRLPWSSSGPQTLPPRSLAYKYLYIFTFTLLGWQMLHLSIPLRAGKKRRAHIWIICLLLRILCTFFFFFISPPNIRGAGWFEWRSIRQGAKRGKMHFFQLALFQHLKL